MPIPRPSEEEVEKYLKQWDSLENYRLQEQSLKKLFTTTYPLNDDIDEVLIKVCSLNDFYSTNIFSPFTVAKHIVALGIDDALSKGDSLLVNKIALVKMPGKKTKNFYSFATKYCSHHYPEIFPIYDSYLEKVLMCFKTEDKFSEFGRLDLKTYGHYKQILADFTKFYNLQRYSVKQIDRYLWQVGKEYFKKIY